MEIVEKLDDFKKFNSNISDKNKNKNHSIRYSNSDKNNFNDILKTEKNDTLLNKTNNDKEISYYNSSVCPLLKRCWHFQIWQKMYWLLHGILSWVIAIATTLYC